MKATLLAILMYVAIVLPVVVVVAWTGGREPYAAGVGGVALYLLIFHFERRLKP